MKKLFMVFCMAIMVVGSNAFACEGGDCEQVKGDVQPEVGIHQSIFAPGSDLFNGGMAFGNATLNADAHATAKDKDGWVEVQDTEPSEKYAYYRKLYGRNAGNVYKKPFNNHPPDPSEWEYVGPYYGTHKEWQTIGGEADSYARNELKMTSSVEKYGNPFGYTGFHSTFVKAETILGIEGEAWAKGTDGCLQTASIGTEGTIGSKAYGSTLTFGPNGSFAQAGGYGKTIIGFEGYEYDSSTHDSFFGLFPNKAEVDFGSTIKVKQNVFASSYVSPDGTKAGAFAIVKGGEGSLDNGQYGLFGFPIGGDNIKLNSINAQGNVSQSSMATNGMGSYAYGNGSASFSGAVGTTETVVPCFGAVQNTANVGGVAMSWGFNKVTNTAGSVTVTSEQHSYATSGNSGQVIQDVVK